MAHTIVAETVILRNDTPVDRWYVVLEQELANRVDLNLDPVNEPRWLRIAGGGSHELTLNQVEGYHPAATALVVYSWSRSVLKKGQWLGEDFTWGLLRLN